MQRSLEIEAVVRRLWKGGVDRDRSAWENLTTDDPDLRVILGAGDEWLKGDGGLVDIMLKRAEEQGLVGVEFDRLEGFEHGDAGWWAASVVSYRTDGEPFTVRNTGVLVLEAGIWRVTQFHTSMAVSNIASFGYELSKSLADLVDSLGETATDSVVAVSINGTVTLMFTDIEGSTAMSERLGDSVWTDLINSHFSTLGQVVESQGGTIIKTLGDGAMIAFSSARNALAAAIAIQESSATSDLRIRIGVHTGDAVYASGDYAGIAVNKAARITSAAEGGEILVSAVTAELAGGQVFQFGAPRSHDLKGLSGTHDLIPVIWESAKPQ